MVEKIKNVRVETIGNNIWKDARENVYIVNKDKTAFLKMDNRQAKLWQFLKMRLVLAGLVAFFIDYYFEDITVGLIVGVVLYVAMELYYRIVFMKQLAQVGKIKDPSEVAVDRFARFKNASKKDLMKGAGMSALLDVLLIVNFFALKYSPAVMFDFSNFKLAISVWAYLAVVILISSLVVINVIYIIKKKDEQ